MEKQSISDWVAITKTQKSGWSQFYRAMIGTPLSDIPRFLKAVNDFGHATMFEAILAASTRKLTGDPLNYVIGIALNKTKEEVQELEDAERYRMRIEKMKNRSQSQNEDLEERIRKARNNERTI